MWESMQDNARAVMSPENRPAVYVRSAAATRAQLQRHLLDAEQCSLPSYPHTARERLHYKSEMDADVR